MNTYLRSNSCRLLVKSIIVLVCTITLFFSLAKHAQSIARPKSFDRPVEQVEADNRQEITAKSYQEYWQKAGGLLQFVQPSCADATVFPIPPTLQ